MRKVSKKVSKHSVKNARPSARVAQINQERDTRIASEIVKVVGQRGWQGSMAELTTVLSKRAGRATAAVLPANPRGMRSAVDRVVRALRRAGIKTQFSRTPDHLRKRVVTFSR